MRFSPYGQGLSLMQIAGAVVGSASAAQVIAPRMWHVEIDFGNGEGADYWAEQVEHLRELDRLRLIRGYADDGSRFAMASVPLFGGKWTVNGEPRP